VQASAVFGDGSFDGFAEVAPQVPAVSDLDGQRRPAGAALGIAACPVPADHLGSGPLSQPGGEGVSGPPGQDVHRPAGLHVDQHCPVRVAAAQGELIRAQDLRGRRHDGVR
jgi:hypothetical protein